MESRATVVENLILEIFSNHLKSEGLRRLGTVISEDQVLKGGGCRRKWPSEDLTLVAT
jgi:hypothetical protein